MITLQNTLASHLSVLHQRDLSFDLEQTHHILFADHHGLAMLDFITNQLNTHELEYLAFFGLEDGEEIPSICNHLTWEPFQCSNNHDTRVALNGILDMNAFFWENWKEAIIYIIGSAEFIKKVRQQLPHPLYQSKQIITHIIKPSTI